MLAKFDYFCEAYYYASVYYSPVYSGQLKV